MPKTITQLPAASSVSVSAVVAADNGAGTLTEKVTVGQISSITKTLEGDTFYAHTISGAVVWNTNASPIVSGGTRLLLHFDGTNGSTTITDSSASNLSCVAEGTAEISTAQSKFGGSSLYLDGGGCVQVTSNSLIPGTGDFTLEAWVRPTSITFNQLFSYRNGSNASLAFYADGGTTRTNYRFGAFDAAASSYVANAWNHVALVRSGGAVTLYVGGASVATASSDPSITHNTLTIGATDENDTSETFIGYIDEVRVTTGLARYTANFTPPAAAFTE